MNYVDDAMNESDIIKQPLPKVENKVYTTIKKIENTDGWEKVKFIILYGSVTNDRFTSLSDIDLAVFYDGNKDERFNFRVHILGRVGDGFDIQTFQDLPVYIKMEIISHGQILYYRDYSEVFDIFMQTIKDYRDFKPRLDIYYAGLEA